MYGVPLSHEEDSALSWWKSEATLPQYLFLPYHRLIEKQQCQEDCILNNENALCDFSTEIALNARKLNDGVNG